MSKPILRVGKIKTRGRTTPASVDNHLSRARNTPNAHPVRSQWNEWLAGGPGTISAAVDAKLAKAGIDKSKLRKDATVANDILLTVSPEWFRPTDPNGSGKWDPKKLAAFKREAVAFLKAEMPGRVVAAVLHLDEATPHVQAVVVPLIRKPDNTFRLSGRDVFNREALKHLQGAWEARLSPLGVGPRVQGSRARHTTLKRYYSALEATPEPASPLPPSPPPLAARLGSAKAMAAWQSREVQKATKRQKPLEVAAARGLLYEAERRTNTRLREYVADEAATNVRLMGQVQELQQAVEVSKDQAARLRAMPINQVALALGFTGEIAKKENAIDLVKRVGGLDYQGAVAWLHHAFGKEATANAAAAAARAEVLGSPSPAPAFTRAEQTKARAIERQLDALAAPAYRITIMRNVEGQQIGQNLGKAKDSAPERTFTKNDILGMLPALTAHNARGGNVFITPLDPAARHVLIDDLKGNQVEALKARGYQPATVLETSPGNRQAIIKLPGDADERAANEWFKALNRELGDEKITGLVHPFRLAGFQNRKDKHQQPDGRYPFVQVVEAANRLCAHACKVVAEMAQQLDELTHRRRPQM